MNTQILFKEKLSKMLFLEVNLQALNKVFNVVTEEEIYLPIHSHKLIDEAKNNKAFEKLNIADFIEGMFYVMGCDPFFKYCSLYTSILISNEDISKKVVKKAIYDRIQSEDFLDAYILLKGLVIIDDSKDVLDKLLLLSDGLRKKDEKFKEEALEVISKCKNLNINNAYYYESLIYFDEFEYENAIASLEEYICLGGEENDVVVKYKEELNYLTDYKIGKDKVYDDPREALSKLLPLLDITADDAVLYYYIAIAYRLIDNNEKAIFYLNEALHKDSDFIDVINELGLNYACLGEYNEALKYFKKAFEASQSVEVCTNIIMTYNAVNDVEKAKEYIEIARRINPEDSILKEIEESLS